MNPLSFIHDVQSIQAFTGVQTLNCLQEPESHSFVFLLDYS